jgi:hypothetical protein
LIRCFVCYRRLFVRCLPPRQHPKVSFVVVVAAVSVAALNTDNANTAAFGQALCSAIILASLLLIYGRLVGFLVMFASVVSILVWLGLLGWGGGGHGEWW